MINYIILRFPEFWEILFWNYIHWSSDLLKAISHYVLVVSVVILCWDPLLNVRFQPTSRPRMPLCASRQPTMFHKWSYFTSRSVFPHAKCNCSKLGHTVVMNIWNVDAPWRQTYSIWVKLFCFISVITKLSYLLVCIMLLSYHNINFQIWYK